MHSDYKIKKLLNMFYSFGVYFRQFFKVTIILKLHKMKSLFALGFLGLILLIGINKSLAQSDVLGESVPMTDERIVDAFATPVDSVMVDQQIVVTVDIENISQNELSFSYFVQVQDENGIVLSFSFMTDSIMPGQQFTLGQSWFPSEAGQYTASMFLWNGINSPWPLSESKEITISVS